MKKGNPIHGVSKGKRKTVKNSRKPYWKRGALEKRTLKKKQANAASESKGDNKGEW